MSGMPANNLLQSFAQEGSLERLCNRILAGKVVFFVGAGFSLESENNSSWRLIARVLARFMALTEVLLRIGDLYQQSRAREIRKVFFQTFELTWDDRGDISGADSIKELSESISTLSRSYYKINDWMCTAFDELLTLAKDLHFGSELLKVEVSLLAALEIKFEPRNIDQKLYEPIFGHERGKALVLDSMGFDNADVMAGDPFQPNLDGIQRSYKRRLRARHFVLARLAREGLCPILITTNFDLLLEGAYRLAGFGSENDRLKGIECPVPTSYPMVARIAEAGEFFAAGEGYGSALVIKIHGCVEKYRISRSTIESWKAYLPAMVFTYRGIQNWRSDSWSRDYIRTLLRTRTFAFCGYSGADPVIHDTIRSVYEEMAEQRKILAPTMPIEVQTESKQSSAPAFFFGIAERREFEGIQILKAASHASSSTSSSVIDHPNYIQFDKDGSFPSVDEELLWLFHRVYRQLQLQAISTDLRLVARRLLGRPVSNAAIEAVMEGFNELEQNECRAVADLDGSAASRAILARICAWTDHFQPSLLRELALGEAFLRRSGPGVDFCRLRQTQWYYPASERPDWTAWAALTEIALRRGIAATRSVSDSWAQDDPHVTVAPLHFPAVFFSRPGACPDLVGILVGGFTRVTQPQVRGFAVRRCSYWQLSSADLPWPIRREGQIPPARAIWAWASGAVDVDDQDWQTALGGAAS